MLDGKARDGLKRLPGPVLVPDTGRNEVDRVVLAAFELSADFPLVFGVQGAPVMRERRLRSRAERSTAAPLCRAPVVTPVTRSNRLGVVGLAGVQVAAPARDEPADANIPQRVGRHRVGEIAEVHRRRRDVRPRRRFERRDDGRPLGVDSDLVVKALHQLPSRGQPPRELREDLLHLVHARERRDRCPAGCRSRAATDIRRRTTAGREWPARRGCS